MSHCASTVYSSPPCKLFNPSNAHGLSAAHVPYTAGQRYHTPVPSPTFPLLAAAHKSTCYPPCLLLIFAQYIYFCSSSNVLFFSLPTYPGSSVSPTPTPPASHTCYASLLLPLLTLTSSLTSHAGVLGAIPLCAAPRSAQLLRDVEYKRVEKSRVEQRYGREIRTDGQKRKSKRIREQEE